MNHINNELSVEDLRVLEALVRRSLSRFIATDEDYALLEILQKIQEALENYEKGEAA